MNDREKNVLAKLAEYNFCTNETKAVLHMLGGGDFRTVPVPDSSRERLITMLKKKRIIEKVQGRYVFTPEFAGVFNGGSVRDGKLVPSPAAASPCPSARASRRRCADSRACRATRSAGRCAADSRRCRGGIGTRARTVSGLLAASIRLPRAAIGATSRHTARMVCAQSGRA